jgi:hypothetical protein
MSWELFLDDERYEPEVSEHDIKEDKGNSV